MVFSERPTTLSTTGLGGIHRRVIWSGSQVANSGNTTIGTTATRSRKKNGSAIRAIWKMLRRFVGRYALLGVDWLDDWNQPVNEPVLSNEFKKLDKDAKRQLAGKLPSEA